MQIEVPADWLAEPCEIDVLVPRRLVCARCDGGGCDGCGRSGALRAPAEGAARTVHVHLPPSWTGVAVRIAEPFGAEVAIAQMILEIHGGARPSPGVTRRVAALALAPARRAPTWPGMTLLGLAAAAAILITILAR